MSCVIKSLFLISYSVWFEVDQGEEYRETLKSLICQNMTLMEMYERNDNNSLP